MLAWSVERVRADDRASVPLLVHACITIVKEAYYNGKRGLLQEKTRPVTVVKEAYYKSEPLGACLQRQMCTCVNECTGEHESV